VRHRPLNRHEQPAYTRDPPDSAARCLRVPCVHVATYAAQIACRAARHETVNVASQTRLQDRSLHARCYASWSHCGPRSSCWCGGQNHAGCARDGGDAGNSHAPDLPGNAPEETAQTSRAVVPPRAVVPSGSIVTGRVIAHGSPCAPQGRDRWHRGHWTPCRWLLVRPGRSGSVVGHAERSTHCRATSRARRDHSPSQARRLAPQARATSGRC